MQQVANELWAIVNADGDVMFSRGGSSTGSRLMVYDSKAKAKRGLNNAWTQQVHGNKELFIEVVYSSTEESN